MAVKASSNITLYHVIDVASVTIYYLLQSSTANPPAKPTTDNPGGNWSNTEPPYTEGSTNTLYTVTKTKFSDGTFEYTPVSKSSSYEAAKNAYNKATNADTNANTALNTINNLQIGGRNYILKSNTFTSGGGADYGTSSTSKTIHPSIENGLWKIVVDTPTNSNWLSWSHVNIIEDNFKENDKFVFSFDIKSDDAINTTPPKIYFKNGMGYYKMTGTVSSKWSRVYYIGSWKDTNSIDFHLGWNGLQGTYYIRKLKFEAGTKPSDWTPAPEDIDEAIINLDSKHDYIVGTQTAATNAWTGVASFAGLHDGQEITYWLPWAGNYSGATLNLTLSGGNTTGAKNVYYGGTIRVSNQYPAGSIIRMVYRENVAISGSTTKYTGWWCDANYDTNNTDRLRFQNNIKTNKQYIWGSRLIVSDDNGYFPLRNGSSFNKDRSMLWAGSNLGPLSTGNNNYIAYPGWDMRCNAYQYYANSKWNNGTVYNLIDVNIGGNKMYSGNKITGTSTTATIFSGSGITSAVVNDRYVNTDNGNYYKCTVAGAAAVAKWVYEGNSRIPEGQRIYWGTHLTHTDGSAKATATTISSVAIGDKYINHNTGRLYECTKAGASGTAQWTDKGVILQNSKTVYLVGVIHGQTITADSVPFVTEEPTEEDGKIYMAIGMAYQIYACGLFPEHPIFMYKGSEFKSIEQITYDTANLANQAADDASKAKSDIQRFLEGDDDTTLSKLRSTVTEQINAATGEITDNFETLVGNTIYGQQAASAATDLQSINSFIKRAVNSSGQPYLELGVQPSSSIPQTYRLRIENDEIYMVYGSGDSEDLLPLTRWYSKDGKSSFEVNTLLTQQEMAIEPFRFIKNDDGSLSFRKVE